MSAIDRATPRVWHLPAGEGDSWWVYGDKDTIKATADNTGGDLALVETTFAPGDGPPPHIHRRESESIYVLDGEVEILDGDRTFRVGPGGFVHMPRGSLHAFKNVGTELATILLLFAPAGFEGYLMEMGERTPPSESERAEGADLAKAARIGAKYGMEIVEPPAES